MPYLDENELNALVDKAVRRALRKQQAQEEVRQVSEITDADDCCDDQNNKESGAGRKNDGE